MTKVRNSRFLCLILSMLFIIVLALGEPVYASSTTDVDSVTSVATGSSEITRICSQGNNSVGIIILNYNSGEGSLSFDNSAYSGLDIEQKRTFMETALGATKECNLGSQQKNRVYNFIAKQDSTVSAAMKYLKTDTSADFASAQAWFKPFSSPISTVMGFLCIVIFVTLGFSFIFDVSYLVLPGFQLIVEHGDDNKKPFGVSKEAWKANRETESVNESKSAMLIYVKKRISVILLIAICLGYLISGKIYDLCVWFIDAFNI